MTGNGTASEMSDEEIAERLRAYGLYDAVIRGGYPACLRYGELRAALPRMDLKGLAAWIERRKARTA